MIWLVELGGVVATVFGVGLVPALVVLHTRDLWD